jgi:hypothetical protein
MTNPFNIAREMVRLDTDMSEEVVIADLRRMFPSATIADLVRACEVGRDQVATYLETSDEDLREIRRMVAEFEEAKAELERAKVTSATIFPIEPDKSRS